MLPSRVHFASRICHGITQPAFRQPAATTDGAQPQRNDGPTQMNANHTDARLVAGIPATSLLTWLLRIAGGALLLAAPCSLLPMDWMSAAHNALGLGPLPQGPIVVYLARSASLLYAMHGAILLALAADVQRYRPLIACIGLLTFAFGAGVALIDAGAGLPWYWTALEGPPTALMGAATYRLARAVRD